MAPDSKDLKESEDFEAVKEITVRRLSVIIPVVLPGPTLKRSAERAVESVLREIDRADPIGTEVVVAVCDAVRSVGDHLKTIFQDAIQGSRLQVIAAGQTLDLARARNEAAHCAHGSLLAFLNPEDSWLPGYLAWLEPWLARHDLILASDRAVAEPSDWLRSFLDENPALSSSTVVRRALFDEVGGFPSGYLGKSDYGFWIRCLACLAETQRRDRFVLLPNRFLVAEATHLQRLPVVQSVDRIRELTALLGAAPGLPSRYWGAVAGRISQALVRPAWRKLRGKGK